MAFDGITTAHIVHELRETLVGGGISRIIQPEKDELCLTVKNNKTPYLLYMSANASLPLIYLTEDRDKAPLTAPNFCMFLRKHIQGGRILTIDQPSLERVISLSIEHRNELGDLCMKKLIIELMGKHSNIILTDDKDTILDSIKHVPASMSSVRQVLPGRPYFIPGAGEKADPLTFDRTYFREKVLAKPLKAAEALYKSYTGFSPLAAEEFCYEAGLDGGRPCASLTEEEKEKLSDVLEKGMSAVREGRFDAGIIYDDDSPIAFSSLPLLMYGDLRREAFSSVSKELVTFYSAKNAQTHILEKTANLRHQVQVALDRVNKKAALQEKQLKDTEKKEKYRIYGELLNAYGYSAEPGASSLEALNYYDNETISIPLDPTLSPSENAQKYFTRYNKLKRTESSLTDQLASTLADRAQLESILTALSLSENAADISAIRRELEDGGWIKRHTIKKGKVREEKSKPMLFESSDGFTIAVGKNNLQNDELTFKYANGGDWWFHAKGRPGSHVILKTEGREVPDRAFEEAASLAAHFSKDSGENARIEIDYTLRREVKKTPGGKAGFVIYHQNYSMLASTDISRLKRLE